MSIAPFDHLDRACLAAFGRDLVYLPQAGGQATVRGIVEATRELEAESPGIYVVVFARASDFPVPPARGDTVVVDGKNYQVWDVEADLEGGLIIRGRQ